MLSCYLLLPISSQVTSLLRSTPSKRWKPLLDGLSEGDKCYLCFMITSVPTSNMGPLICSPRFVQRPVAWGESEGIHFQLGPSVGQYCSDTRWKCTRDTLLQTSEDLQGHSTWHEWVSPSWWRNEPTGSLFLPSDATLTVRGWKQIAIELPKVFLVPVNPQLPQSRARRASFPRGTAWHGIKGAVAKTTVLISMKPRNQETKVESQARPEVVQLIVLDLPNQRGKAKEFVSFGNRVVVTGELIAISFMRVLLANRDKPLLPVRLVATLKIKRRPVRTRKGRDPVALRAQRALSRRNPKDRGPAPHSRHLPLFALLHPCLHPCPRPCASLSRESFVHRFVLMNLRTWHLSKLEGTWGHLETRSPRVRKPSHGDTNLK